MICIQISVEELESSISVKISKEAVMSISSPGSLFSAVSGKLETKVYIAGLPNRTDNVIKQVSIHSASVAVILQDSVNCICVLSKTAHKRWNRGC